MELFIDRLKLKAATKSMHQFCGAVRSFLPERTDDAVVETATFYLYIKIAREVFGRRFARALRWRLRDTAKFASPEEIERRAFRIERQAEKLRKAADSSPNARSPEARFQNYVSSVIESLLSQADSASDREARRNCFTSFEEAARKIKTHLVGIRNQPRIMMK